MPLVVSRSLVLSAGAEASLPDGTPLIGYHNVVAYNAIGADSEDDDHPAVNLANEATDLYWQAANTDAQNVSFTTNYLGDIDYLAIAGHNFGTGAISVKVERFVSTDEDVSPPVETWEELISARIPADDRPLLFAFEAQSIDRIRVVLGEGDEAARMAVVYVGKLLVMERGREVNKEHTPPRFGRKTTVVNGRAEAGHFLGRVITGQEIAFTETWNHLTPDWYRTYFEPFMEVAQQGGLPFFYVWAPEDYESEVAFAWLKNDPMPVENPVTERMNVTLDMGGVVQ